jgi:hypothetical protein
MPARRDLLRTGGTAAFLTIAGCVQGFATESERETTETGTTTTASASRTDEGESGEGVSISVETDDGERALVTGSQISVAGEVREAGSTSPFQLPVTISETGRASFLDGLAEAGAFDAPEEHRVRIYAGEELVYEARLGQDLIHAFEAGEWEGSFVIPFDSREAVERVREQIAGD